MQKNSTFIKNDETTDNEIRSTLKLEKVDEKLLNRYIDYEMQLEAASFKRNDAGIAETSSAKMSLKEFDLMINNFLVNERNQMRKDYFMKTISQTTQFLKNINISPGVLPAPPGTVFVECIGTVTGQNSISTILFLAGVYNNYAYHPTFSFGGFSGTMAPTGNFIQSRSQGAVTYRQYYTETIHQSNGGTYT